MAGPAQRTLTLTEELEKLEQSITLTLQEIDSNFSRAHRIVTTSILPVVEQYAEQSKDVWEGAKFWKQFFESSANVSLSGYEEQPNEDTEHEQTVTEDSTNITTTHTDDDASYETPSSEHGNEVDFSSLTISPSHSTPRATAHKTRASESPSLMAYSTPFDGRNTTTSREDDTSTLPETTATPVRSKYHPSETPTSSPFLPPPSSHKPDVSTAKRTKDTTDPVLHHVLDKTYRVQATPLSKGFKSTKFAISTPKDKPTSRYAFDSPLSSPELEAPKLHDEIFSSPMKGLSTPGSATNRANQRRRRQSTEKKTPKPGISVLTPAAKRIPRSGKSGWESDEVDINEGFDDDDDDTDAFGISPPKTMQFHIPHSRLLKTPAKEASKRIVEDLLATAGGTGTTADDLTGGYEVPHRTGEDEEYSPTVVRSGARLEDDTF
ncbi:DASH complex subunit Ask1-domain-containing protein [Talaromyces proteolyticus]|uniref:DASH complex subunit ASK1 n=1 Tax=Talaromyces proteolyticus TaxID=1131652 RepID=A0AAD4KTB1_9EURO|nr:DASH complex subunit Ask1-domain-containing protein [Talaromyces proteolyticus]KAH8698410.1 DASH complex subunit Ask1-domain-containing protein [Talaromyces proteolyticus]